LEEFMLANHSRLARAMVLAACCLMGACAEPSSSPSVPSLEDRFASQIPWAGNPQLSKALAALRDTTDIYHDVNVAFAAGYRPSSAGCESDPTGAMGIHYGHGGLLGIVRGSNPPTGTDAVIDPLRPEVLLYEPQADGSRRLVGIEFVVYRAAWDAVNPSPPTFAGVPFDRKFGSESHGHADHYELHIWLWRNNPLGMFAPWNPKVSCAL
jgi:hypothetical protein